MHCQCTTKTLPMESPVSTVCNINSTKSTHRHHEPNPDSLLVTKAPAAARCLYLAVGAAVGA